MVAEDAGYLKLFESDNLACKRKESRDVGSDKVFALAEADNEWREIFSNDKIIGLSAADDADGVGAFEAGEGLANSLKKVGGRLKLKVNQVGNNFRVRFGSKGAALSHELGFQFSIIFDDAVVNDGQAVDQMGMGVVFGRAAVGCPPRMADAESAVRIGSSDKLGERRDLASGADDFEVRAVMDGQTGRIVTAIFQTLQALKQNGRSLIATDVTNYATHCFLHFSMDEQMR